MLHVLSVIDDVGFGGDENRLLAFARTIDRRRFRHTVMTIRGADGCSRHSRAMRDQFQAAGVDLIDLDEADSEPQPQRAGPARVRAAVRRLARKAGKLGRFVRAEQVDVIDAHLESAGLVGALTGMSRRVPCVLTLYAARTTAPWPAWASWNVLGRLSTWASAAVVTDSEPRAAEIRRWARPARVRVAVIPNGVPPPAPSCPAAETRKALGLPDGERVRVVGQIGGLVPYKGYPVLLRAAKAVLERRSDVFFLLVGFERPQSGYAEQLRRMAAELGIASHVRVVSYPGPIGDIWSVIDIHAHASLLDSLPNAIIEGMALGRPSVVTAVGGIPDAVEHGQTGLVVRPDCPEDLADALVGLLDDPERAQCLARAANQRYWERYRPETMTRRLEQLFESVGGRMHERDGA